MKTLKAFALKVVSIVSEFFYRILAVLILGGALCRKCGRPSAMMLKSNGRRIGLCDFHSPLVLVFVSFFGCCNGFAADTITFTPFPQTGVTNFSIYYGPHASRSVTNRVHIGTSTNWVVTNVAPATAAFVYATAWTNGVESYPSAELIYTNRQFAPTIQLNMILERGLSPVGPYQITTNQLVLVAAVDTNAFYRVRMEAIRNE